MSFNEGILKVMVQWGQKQNMNETYSYPYPWQISEGKYGIKYYVTLNRVTVPNGTGTNVLNGYNYVNRPLYNKMWNYYVYTGYGSGYAGFLSDNANSNMFASVGNGYGTCFQDNYEDKPEVRVNTHGYLSYNNHHSDYYSKNGDVCTNEVRFRYASYDIDSAGTPRRTTIYKSTASQYQGLIPVFAA